MLKKTLVLIALIASIQSNCTSYKDSFVIDAKKGRGENAVNIVPSTATVTLYKEDTSYKSYEDIEKIEQVKYENVSLAEPLPLSNSLIKKGYIHVGIRGQLTTPSTGKKQYFSAFFNIKPNHSYTLTLPIKTDVGSNKTPRYVCPDGNKTGNPLSLCVTESKLE